MEIKVKEVGVIDSKSVQEVEKELLEKHEEKLNEEVASDVVDRINKIIIYKSPE